MTLLLISIAGALGATLRFLMEYAVRRHHPTQRPWATVAANALGSLIAGYVVYRLTSVADTSLHQILLTGFCGGLTTFSSAFAIPALLQREHHWAYAAAIVVTTPLTCVVAFVVGMSLSH